MISLQRPPLPAQSRTGVVLLSIQRSWREEG